MGVARPTTATIALFFLAGANLLLLFVLLGGANNSNPLKRFYFLEADTSRIPGAPKTSRWTFWAICGKKDGHNDCHHRNAGVPLDPPGKHNFQTKQGVPRGFIGTRHYYYITRFFFAFYLIEMFFAVCALIAGFMACCTRIGSWISSFLTLIALVFQIVTASLMTAGYVQGRNKFHHDGRHAKVGRYMFAFMWTSVVLLFISSILYCIAGIAPSAGKAKDEAFGKKKSNKRRKSSSGRAEKASDYV
ncbi:actin cortical patch protein Sur7 [Ascosphaera apis ARSEF 7405]|uniref:Actin cortical patch protein Sur7 n=1 Tax=Ascosphaera apis ARSEF 7405 TaxID=392613 RepID=A0A162IFJ9_9EURO|nr:actin cortical patch protein Sur7 [Ascosphaera apis ARSEF 7405]